MLGHSSQIPPFHISLIFVPNVRATKGERSVEVDGGGGVPICVRTSGLPATYGVYAHKTYSEIGPQ